MVKKQHKIISLILCLLLAVTAVCVGTVGAFAASGDVVYVKANNGWTDLYCYMWTDGGSSNASWPGVKMTNVEDDVYCYQLDGDYEMVIFNNNGNGSSQTSNLTYPGNNMIYDLTAGSWSSYTGETVESSSTSSTESTTASTTSSSSDDGITVYLENEAGWSTPYCYMWNSSSDENSSWPGVAMTSVGDDVYMYSASKEYANCIFNNNGSSQTSDLTAYDGYIYNNSSNTWSVYDTSPLQVKSYSADPSSKIYIETEVTLSATAVNSDGAEVSYKFSVTNESGGTSVISAFSSTNSVTWTPSAAGTYTITFDFKDTDGNENSRTLSLTVEDDSLLTKPVIKSVSPANLNLIKVNESATVTVKAGGGNTGTNLLFYKYVVTDPNNVTNTPYYTLNSTYTFEPTMEGDYKVVVYVQGSDNSTVNKTYTYTATSGEIPSTTAPTTSTILLGDADDNGVVDIKDVTYLQHYLAEETGYSVEMDVCDIDGDNEITIKDATGIQRIIIES